jgi:hypothetical protein
MSTPPPGEREAPKQDEVPLPEPTRLAHEAGELYHEWQSFEACWEDLRVPAEQRGENWRDHCAIRDKWHAKFAEFNAALIAYGNARARAATERAAQVCREAGVTRGHGHITPRADGVKARCGGPAFCKTCQREQAANEARWKVVAEVQRQFAPVLKAAIELLCAVDAQHEKEPPLKYTIPYGAVNNLRSALVPMSDLKPDDSADAGIKGDGR